MAAPVVGEAFFSAAASFCCFKLRSCSSSFDAVPSRPSIAKAFTPLAGVTVLTPALGVAVAEIRPSFRSRARFSQCSCDFSMCCVRGKRRSAVHRSALSTTHHHQLVLRRKLASTHKTAEFAYTAEDGVTAVGRMKLRYYYAHHCLLNTDAFHRVDSRRSVGSLMRLAKLLRPLGAATTFATVNISLLLYTTVPHLSKG